MKFKTKVDWGFFAWLGLTMVAFIYLWNPYSFALIWPIYFASIVGLWFSRFRVWLKITFTIFLPFTWYPIILFFNLVAGTMAKQNIIVVQNDFKGDIRIIYNEPCGHETVFEKSLPVFKIPRNGVLISKYKRQAVLVDPKAYVIDSNGMRLEIPFFHIRQFNLSGQGPKTAAEPPRDKLGLFESGRSCHMPIAGSEEVDCSQYTVGTFSDLKNIGNAWIIDSVTHDELKKCRSNGIREQ
jgi:hypothetical protein